MVRRTTPVTVRCQPPSPFTRAARPPPRTQGGPLGGPGHGGGGRRRAGGATAHASRAPALPLHPRFRPPLPPPPARGRAPHRPCPRRAPSDCADPWSLCGVCSPRLRSVRTRIPPLRRARSRTGTRQTHHSARSFTRLRVIWRRHQRRPRRGVGIELRLDVLVRRRPRALHAQLLEQERERFLEIRPDRRANVGGKIPEPPLERSDRLLAALVDELFLGVAFLPLFLGFHLDPRVHFPPQTLRQGGMIHDDRLEIGGEVDLDGLTLRELRERFRRQRRRAVLDRAAESILLARVQRERLQRLEIE